VGADDNSPPRGSARKGNRAGQDDRKVSRRSAGARRGRLWRRGRYTGPAYGALDLGTNNCRLLVARPTHRGFKVIDAFSRIVRLGEGLTRTRHLSDAAMTRTIEALKVCTEKLARRNVSRSRLIATEACRTADNCADFLDRVYRETGLRLEVINRETEAKLAVAGSASLIDPKCRRALVFDIGGGSSELMWLASTDKGYAIEHWVSLPVGVVTLAEQFGGRDVDLASFRAMTGAVAPYLAEFSNRIGPCEDLTPDCGHMLGTSGTVTTLAGVSMGLKRYDRSRVDGCWLSDKDIKSVTENLMSLTYEQRVASPCIGHERADLVLAGCAILQAIMEQWPCSRVRVADRGLREGILTSLMENDGHDCSGRSNSRRRRSRRPPGS
jgi:exopolyphosphatase/guanosine-5'-triphosphate,3'-diphosphate pyrophosphatase